MGSKEDKTKLLIDDKTVTICEGKPNVLIQTNIALALTHEVFSSLDHDGDGVISVEELEAGLKQLELPVSRTEAQRFFNLIDLDNDGQISFSEFKTFTQYRQRQLRRIFNLLDRNQDGSLSSDEMKQAIYTLGLSVSTKQLKEVMKSLASETGELDYERFRRALLLLPTVNPDAIFEAYETIDDGASETFSRQRDLKTGVGQSTLTAIGTQLYAGGIAGCVSRTATAPLERFKVIVQSRLPGAPSSPVGQQITAIYQESGFLGFWRGNGANCMKIAPETATKFMLFEYFKQRIAEDPDNVSVFEKFISGGLAGMGAQLLVYPLEVLKTRMSISPPGHYKGWADCLNQIYVNRGFRGLYKGCGASTIGIIPYAGVDLMMNSVIRERGAEYYRKVGRDPGLVILLGAGMMSSSTAMSCTYPINLIRTRLQASGMDGAPVYTGFRDCLQKTLAADGPVGLYRGFGANLLKVLPSTSISYAVYDILRNQRNRL